MQTKLIRKRLVAYGHGHSATTTSSAAGRDHVVSFHNRSLSQLQIQRLSSEAGAEANSISGQSF
jgi:hypothetical protein